MQVIKSNNAAEVGLHCFEHAGLGRAPFSIAGFRKEPSHCAFCGTGILWQVLVQSADGRRFHVGSDCMQRCGDAGLIRRYKNHPDVREHQRQLRIARDEDNKIKIAAILTEASSKAKLAAHLYFDGSNMLDTANKSLPWCGAAGRARWLSAFKKVLNA